MRPETGPLARTHDLLRLRAPRALAADAPVPPWVLAALGERPWVVVRRGPPRPALIPVGVRGGARSQRFAAFLADGDVVDRVSPDRLTGAAVTPERLRAAPALAALARLAPVLSGRRWGPGGSVGFELATGAPAVTPASDLDLIVWQDQRLPPDQAAALLAALRAAAAPVRVDAIVETPAGGVALAELAALPARVLVRTPDGPRLCADPWARAAPDAEAA